MKTWKIYLLISSLALLGIQAQAQISALMVTVDPAQMTSIDCNLTGANEVYVHSGLCTSDAQTCAVDTTTWEHIVGNWGMSDGLGLMTDNGNGTFSMCIDFVDYYGDTNNINTQAGGTVMAPGATPYRMGLVFRNGDGSIEGKDALCADIWIGDLNTGSPVVKQTDGSPYPAITAVACGVGIEKPTELAFSRVYPNPAGTISNIDYALNNQVNDLEISVYNSLGQKMATLLQGSQVPGLHSLTWDGNTDAGQSVSAGLYILRINTQTESIRKRIVRE